MSENKMLKITVVGQDWGETPVGVDFPLDELEITAPSYLKMEPKHEQAVGYAQDGTTSLIIVRNLIDERWDTTVTIIPAGGAW